MSGSAANARYLYPRQIRESLPGKRTVEENVVGIGDWGLLRTQTCPCGAVLHHNLQMKVGSFRMGGIC